MHRLAYKLEAPEGVRLNEMTVTHGPVPDYKTIDRSELPDWPRLEHAVRAFIAIDCTFQALQAELTPEQRMAQGISS